MQIIPPLNHMYVGFDSHGCMISMVADMADVFTAKTVKQMEKEKLTVKHLPFDEVKKLIDEKGFGCNQK